MSRLRRKVERLKKKLEKLAPTPSFPRVATNVTRLSPEKLDRMEALLVLACGPGARSEPDLSHLNEQERAELDGLLKRSTVVVTENDDDPPPPPWATTDRQQPPA